MKLYRLRASNEFKHRIVDSVSEIRESDWNEIFGNIPEGYHFYKTLEESRLDQFSFHYILLFKGEKIVSIAPLFVSNINLDITLDGAVRKALSRMRKLMPNFLIVKALFCGSPFGENGVLGMDKNLSEKERREVLHELTRAMNKLCRKKRIPFMAFKDFQKVDGALLRRLGRKNFFRIESLPSVTMELTHSSAEEYLNSLSHSRRKDLNRKMRKATEAGVEVEVIDNIDHMIDDIYNLYLNTYNAGEVKFEKLTKDFFINISKNMKSNVKFFLYYVNNKLSAFNLCFVYNDRLIDKFIGFDYDVSREHSLYFVSWLYNVDWCINKSIRYYQTGQTDYEPKLSMGGKPVPLYAYVKHRNPVSNLFLRSVAGLLKL